MIWLAHLFRPNHDARRARWFVFGACCGSIVIGAAYEQSAMAADEATCRTYSAAVERLVHQLTNDVDVSQAARDSGYSWCVWTATEPPSIKIETATAEAGTAPATGPEISPRDRWCQTHFRSYRSSDGTVIRGGARRRSACPWPG